MPHPSWHERPLCNGVHNGRLFHHEETYNDRGYHAIALLTAGPVTVAVLLVLVCLVVMKGLRNPATVACGVLLIAMALLCSYEAGSMMRKVAGTHMCRFDYQQPE